MSADNQSCTWLQHQSAAQTSATSANVTSHHCRYGRLKQVALRSVAHSLAADSEALQGMREMFEQFDTDGNGLISHADMVKVRAARSSLSPQQACSAC